MAAAASGICAKTCPVHCINSNQLERVVENNTNAMEKLGKTSPWTKAAVISSSVVGLGGIVVGVLGMTVFRKKEKDDKDKEREKDNKDKPMDNSSPHDTNTSIMSSFQQPISLRIPPETRKKYECLLDKYIDLFIGIALLFFGGSFAVTICLYPCTQDISLPRHCTQITTACYMAIQLSGWEQIERSSICLLTSYQKSIKALEQDNAAMEFIDVDRDGHISVSDLVLISLKAIFGSPEDRAFVLAKLKLIVVGVDPTEIMNAFQGLWQTAIAVMLTIRHQFARNIALGVSMGKIMAKSVLKHCKPLITKYSDDDTEKWWIFVIESFCRLFGIYLAFTLERGLYAFNSALKGSQMITQ
eukprot:913537_1